MVNNKKESLKNWKRIKCIFIYVRIISDGDDDKCAKYKFGIYGLKNKSELLQIGDPVRFQVDSNKRAVNIVALRDKSRATVDSMKGGIKKKKNF